MKIRNLFIIILTFILKAITNVYCDNTIINLRLEAGFNLVVNQLFVGENLLSDVYPSMPEGTMIYTYTSVNGYSISTYEGNQWSTNLFLPPAMGHWVRLNQSMTNTYVGRVMEGMLIIPLNVGFNLVGSMVPQEGGLSTILGYTPEDGDMVYMHDNQLGYSTYTYDVNEWIPSEPFLKIGQGVWIRKKQSSNWIRIFKNTL